ncbi:hypothetical protein SHO565_43130 [Streptomyces sp. HO565]
MTRGSLTPKVAQTSPPTSSAAVGRALPVDVDGICVAVHMNAYARLPGTRYGRLGPVTLWQRFRASAMAFTVASSAPWIVMDTCPGST